MEEEQTNNLNTLFSRIVKISGATASITIITLILCSLKIIPYNISVAIGLFISLPLIYSFIFGIITNRPNFTSVIRHYSFTIYIIVSLIIFMFVLKPTSIIEGVRYFFYFFVGFFLAIIGYSTYSLSYNLVSKKTEKYRWRASISFGVSLLITFIITFILKYFKIFEII